MRKLRTGAGSCKLRTGAGSCKLRTGGGTDCAGSGSFAITPSVPRLKAIISLSFEAVTGKVCNLAVANRRFYRLVCNKLPATGQIEAQSVIRCIWPVPIWLLSVAEPPALPITALCAI